jgi:hypothetical protein
LHLQAQASSCAIFVAKENHAAALQDVYPTIAPILPSFDVIRKSSFHCGHHSQRLIHSAKIVVRIVATIVAVNPALLLEHKSGSCCGEYKAKVLNCAHGRRAQAGHRSSPGFWSPITWTWLTICSAGRREVRTDKMIAAAVQRATLIMGEVDIYSRQFQGRARKGEITATPRNSQQDSKLDFGKEAAMQ